MSYYHVNEDILRLTQNPWSGMIFELIVQRIRFARHDEDKGLYKKGRYWYCAAVKDIQKEFPCCVTKWKITEAIKALKLAGLITIEHFDALKMHNISWYTPTDDALKLIGEDRQMRFEKPAKHEKEVTARARAVEKQAHEETVTEKEQAALKEIRDQPNVVDVYKTMTQEFGMKPADAVADIKLAGTQLIKTCIPRVRNAIKVAANTPNAIKSPKAYLHSTIMAETKSARKADAIADALAREVSQSDAIEENCETQDDNYTPLDPHAALVAYYGAAAMGEEEEE